jgi:hypothetical protein
MLRRRGEQPGNQNAVTHGRFSAPVRAARRVAAEQRREQHEENGSSHSRRRITPRSVMQSDAGTESTQTIEQPASRAEWETTMLTAEDRTFITRALAAHAALTRSAFSAACTAPEDFEGNLADWFAGLIDRWVNRPAARQTAGETPPSPDRSPQSSSETTLRHLRSFRGAYSFAPATQEPWFQTQSSDLPPPF